MAEDTRSDPISETDLGATPDATADPDAEPVRSGLQLLLSLLWLAATMWSAHASIAGADIDAAVMISSAAIALPGIIAASLLTGASAALAGTGRFALGATTPRRLGVGLASGMLCGLAAGGAIMLAYGATSAVGLIAGTVAVAAVLGGALVVLPAATLAAGLAAGLSVFVAGVLIYLFQNPLKSLFGASDSVRSQAEAAFWLARTGAAVTGLIAGVIAYRLLRPRNASARWPAYLLAGSIPGLLLLAAEALTLLGGSRLLGLVSGLSDFDRATVGYLDRERLAQGLIVTFVGAIVAMIAVGRTMRPETDELDDSARAPGDPDDPALEPIMADPAGVDDARIRDDQRPEPRTADASGARLRQDQVEF
ncbi:MAG TPA: hypothetical protein VF163_09695 [Micromonosporaceae bacterium]